MKKIYFGGGCFWCTEAVFKMLKGVTKVLPGYAGGTVPNPTYEQVTTGKTGHAEVVLVEYDPNIIKLEDLLTVFFASHDPTTKDRQGNDVGTQYRSVIFYEDQREVIEKFVKELGIPAVTELEPAVTFYEAENYHQDYFETHSGNPYCEIIINPKLEKVQKKFANLLKTI
jgi:peptide-methionine (S)-S-oxide reductase